MKNSSAPSESASREALLATVRALAGASLQKIWLTSSTTCALQLRVPGKSLVVAVDAERAMALVADERPASPDSALKAQATLRAALTGARFESAELVLPLDAPENARQVSLRLSFDTASGKRTLLADPRAHALVLAANDRNDPTIQKLIWTAPGAVAAFRPGAAISAFRIAPAAFAKDNSAEIAPAEQSLAAATLEEGSADRFAREKEAVVRALRSKLQKLARTLGAVERDSAQALRAIGDRRLAELLLPQQSKIPRGAKEAMVPDWSELNQDGEPKLVTIALDPALGAAQNAARMLKKAQRYAAAQTRIAARQGEIAAAHQLVEAQLAQALEATRSEQLKRNVAEAGSAESRTQQGPARRGHKPERLPYRAFRASNGARILVGRSAKDNDALTLRHARGDDLWLHARGVHGSHVILVDPGTAPDTNALAEAALLAAHFSSARGADGAEVSWTRRKYVRKGKGQAPGAVSFSQEKTIKIRLDEALLRALLASEA